MNKYLPLLALLALPACMGGGGESTVAGVTNLNAEFGGVLNGVRMGAGRDAVTYDSRLGQAAQIHADDMVNRDYFSILIQGGGGTDIGDIVTAQGYTWASITQLIEQGEFTVDELLTEFNSVPCGGAGQDLCLTDPLFEDFGIAKAGSGADQKWVLVLTEPG